MKSTVWQLYRVLSDLSDIPSASKHDINELRYLEGGILDSFGLMQFIVAIEEDFNVELTPEDTQSEQFRTLGGIAEIIDEKNK